MSQRELRSTAPARFPRDACQRHCHSLWEPSENAHSKGSTERFHFEMMPRLAKANKRLHLPRLALAAALGLIIAVGAIAPAGSTRGEQTAARRVHRGRAFGGVGPAEGGLPSSGSGRQRRVRKATAQEQSCRSADNHTEVEARRHHHKIGKALEAMNADAAVIRFIRPKQPLRKQVVIHVVEEQERPTVDSVVALDKDATQATCRRRSSPSPATGLRQQRWQQGSTDSGGGSSAGGGDKQPDEKSRTKPPEGEGAVGAPEERVRTRDLRHQHLVRHRWPFLPEQRPSHQPARLLVFGARLAQHSRRGVPLAPSVSVLKISASWSFACNRASLRETSDGTPSTRPGCASAAACLPFASQRQRSRSCSVKGSFIQDGFTLGATGDLEA
jgi:hypothetical protein